MVDVAMSQTPPILHGPSEKEQKYDRQLRLWAASGQAALESANILLVNSGSGTVGIETLKNLVLPGIAAFTIYDPAVVEEADLGVNFFVDEEHLGKSRAQTCTELLLELNPEVQGEWHPKSENPVDLEGLLATSPTFTIILYSNPISVEDLALLEKYGETHKSPMFSIHSAGFHSYFQVNLHGPFPIVDTHPDQTAMTDLRLLSPWLELLEFARTETADIGSLDNHEHGHLPYVVILLHYLDEWRETHDGSHPKDYKEKIAFRKLVSDGTRRDNPEGGEENFEEAVGAVLRNVEKPSLPSGLREVFEYQDNIPSEGRTGFWLIAAAIKQFYDKHQCLPVPGSVPDMKAKSQVYVQLQTIYKDKARKDAEEVLAIAQDLAGGACEVDPAEVDLFCKNAAFVKLINAEGSTADRLQKVAQEQFANDENAEAFMMPHSLMPIYLALHATSHGASSATTPLTEEEIWANITKAVPAAAGNGRVDAAVKEVARAKGGELHNISALTGGMVAQEMIKIITRQYVPIDNTCIFDGIASRTQVLRL